uniref:HMG-Y-related protein A isoform X2 n=1 Tax=Rhizophora mucronata TaxID=61149 RepID=A0A2P2KN78_RHIMU
MSYLSHSSHSMLQLLAKSSTHNSRTKTKLENARHILRNKTSSQRVNKIVKSVK